MELRPCGEGGAGVSVCSKEIPPVLVRTAVCDVHRPQAIVGAIFDLTKEEIGAQDGSGVEAVLVKLDSLWKEDENLEAFIAYERFEQFQRPHDMNVKEYIVAFE